METAHSTKAETVQARINVLCAWIAELNQNFNDELGRVVPFDYLEDLTAAMDLHGITNPQTAWAVFLERAHPLTTLRDQL